ncbi:MAG TPA: hypothetical protein PKU74_10480, partial [Candidatus Omnitrophota bacterium]|nr:hypothetical protein [Candidatus Omnitrophota bacterium]
ATICFVTLGIASKIPLIFSPVSAMICLRIPGSPGSAEKAAGTGMSNKRTLVSKKILSFMAAPPVDY